MAIAEAFAFAGMPVMIVEKVDGAVAKILPIALSHCPLCPRRSVALTTDNQGGV
jgi:hypothetical protein